MKNSPRPCFVALECVSGYCPNIPNEYDVEEYSMGIDCKTCFFNTGACEDCAFFSDKELCPEEN